MVEQFGRGFEGLEERTLLAANVTAVLSNGTLTITGATSGGFVDDDIQVYGDGTTGHVTIDVNGADLKVNGVTDGDGVASFIGVKNIVFNGGAGNDYLDLYDLSITGNVTANGGTGYDIFYGSAYGDDLFIGGSVTATVENAEIWTNDYGNDVTIVKNVTMNGGAGNDEFDIHTHYGNTNIFIGGNVTMNGGAGSDDMEVGTFDTFVSSSYGYGLTSLTVLGNVTMNGGDGNDYGSVGTLSDDDEFGKTSIGGSVTLNGGNGNDVMGVISYGCGSSVDITKGVVMNGGNGDDRLGIATYNGWTSITVGGGVTIHGNAGGDTVGLFSAYAEDQLIDVAGKVELHGDQGNDTIGAFNGGYGSSTIEVGSVLVQGWDGNDDIGAYGVTVLGNAEIWGGNQDDDFTFFNNSIGGNLYVNGWSGFDTLFDDGDNTVGGTTQFLNIEGVPV